MMLNNIEDASTDTADYIGLSDYTKTALKGFVAIDDSSLSCYPNLGLRN